MINLFVAVVLENYNSSVSVMFTSDNLDDFRRLWMQFDTDGLGVITDRRLQDFLQLVPPPLGLPRNNRGKIKAREFIDSKINLVGTQVQWALFYDVLLGLCSQAYTEHTENLPPQVKAEIEDLMKLSRSRVVLGAHIKSTGGMPSIKDLAASIFNEVNWKAQILTNEEAIQAARIIQRRFREYLAMMELRKNLDGFHEATVKSPTEDDSYLISNFYNRGNPASIDASAGRETNHTENYRVVWTSGGDSSFGCGPSNQTKQVNSDIETSKNTVLQSMERFPKLVKDNFIQCGLFMTEAQMSKTDSMDQTDMINSLDVYLNDGQG